MIFVGIDDTDIVGSPGTNQLARVLVATVAVDFRCHYILRHQLLFDRRVHYTSKNGSASIWLSPVTQSPPTLQQLRETLKARMLQWYVPGSDPGLCVTNHVPTEIVHWGLRCQQELVNQQQARNLAAAHGIYLEGLGGTEGGVIGALAAVGLAASGNDGRVVVQGQWPDDLSGVQPIDVLHARGIIVLCLDSGREIETGTVDVGKHLRPNYRNGRVVVFAKPSAPAPSLEAGSAACWEAVRLT